MWYWEWERRRRSGEPEAQVGRVSIGGAETAAERGGERRWLRLCVPGPLRWRPAAGDEVLVLKDSFFEVSNFEQTMTVGPAFGFHHFTEGKEDSEVKTPGAATVYMTDYTAFHHVISIRP